MPQPRRLIRRAIALALVSTVAASAPASATPADFAGAQVSENAVSGFANPIRTPAGLPAGGLGLARVWFWWSDIEVKRGVYDFSHYDRIVADAASAEVRLLPVLIDPPTFHSSAPRRPEPGTYPPSDNADMARFAAVLVARYGADGSFWEMRPDLPRVPIRSWQVWNEPNIYPWWAPWPDAAAYTRLLRTVGAGIKACDPDAEVVAAGLPNSHAHLGPKAGPYIEGMYAAGGRGAFDVLAIHPYGNPTWQVMDQIEEARLIMDSHGDSSTIWVTEFGWGDGGPWTSLVVSSERHAELIFETVRELHARRASLGIRGFTYYQWADIPLPPRHTDSVWYHVGLISADDQPKSALFGMRWAVDTIGLDRPHVDARPASAPCRAEIKEIAATPTHLRSDGEPASFALPTGSFPAGAPAPDSASPSEPAGNGASGGAPATRPTVVAGPVTPKTFRPAASGPSAKRGRRCPRRGCIGALINLRSSHGGALELRFQKTSKGRRPARPSRVASVRVPRGDSVIELRGRAGGRPLARGKHRVLLQLVRPNGQRSALVVRNFRISR